MFDVFTASNGERVHSHIATVVRPPSLKSFANQNNLSNHRVGMLKKPFSGQPVFERLELWLSHD